ncbi:3-isopropylmalate dehydrogenase [Luteibacter yeojuensis]|uniref:3-isopropylmalate dehydrogenase n=1 Tax=Luteibacter yeojuensis TaxID=345309 RepID=A0A7X5TSI3_9GAMM|nr:3-isopropylmalate dehydrogenase [Luteibacter yeojuensis]NID17327.1 3-isopropylmalate dehydrogenase [Luteibacter yeojuensis]
MKASIVVLPGDGIGPEVASAGVAVLRQVAQRFGHEFAFTEHAIGGDAIDRFGDPLPPETREALLAADAVLLGAVGGPKWSDPNASIRPEQGLLAMRKLLGVFANVRPLKLHPRTAALSPLKAERTKGVDLVFIRELTGGIYFGAKTRSDTDATDECRYSVEEIERVLRHAFDLARSRRRKVTSVDKANVLETSRLWRAVATRVAADYPDVELEHQLVDSMAMHLLTRPADYDVIVTENMFGDILTDEASVLAGSLGLSPSASIGGPGAGVYEPIHGSAPDIAGQSLANPLGTILSAAMLLRHSLGLAQEAAVVEAAVDQVLEHANLTRDLGGSATTHAVTRAVLDAFTAKAEAA